MTDEAARAGEGPLATTGSDGAVRPSGGATTTAGSDAPSSGGAPVGPVLRVAGPEDVAAVRAFGEAHVRPHYAPLIGAQAADAQVRTWWSTEYLTTAVEAGNVLLAEVGGTCVGVAQLGRAGEDHVVYKLYVAPGQRGSGLGPRLLDALERRLPADADALHVEHVAANARAAAFYEREGFRVVRVEPDPSGDRARDVVWRARPVRR